MKAIISSTYDDKYYFFIPIAVWAWGKLGVGVVCFVPAYFNYRVDKTILKQRLVVDTISKFAPQTLTSSIFANENKTPTYMQCSRLYGSALQGIPDDDILILGDVDMAVFKLPMFSVTDDFTILGSDLVSDNQYPMCFVTGTKSKWATAFNTSGRTPQQCLDELLGGIECENMRGNYWAKDQEELFRALDGATIEKIPRTNGQNQFAMHRVDRDDGNWRSQMNPDLIDAHLWRPGYTDENFSKILELFTTMYPNDDFQWMIDYKNAYVALL